MRWEDRVGRRLKLRDLHILVTVLQTGSMAKAAGTLAISQPAVSKAIADLEHAVGVRLVDRGPRGVEPTHFGRALARSSIAAFDDLRQGTKEIEFLANPNVGEVRIGVSEGVAATFLPEVINRFRQEAPGVTVHLNWAETITQRFRVLRERQVDLLLGWVLESFSEDEIEVEFLFEEPVVIAAGVRSRWARRSSVEIPDLANANWIVGPGDSDLARRVSEVLLMRGLQLPTTSVVTRSFYFREILLTTGDFVTAMPLSMAQHFNADHLRVKILPIDLKINARPAAIITLRHRTLAPPAVRFIECVRKVSQSITSRARTNSAKRRLSSHHRSA